MRIITIVLIMSLASTHIKARVGCLDNSWHLEKTVDDKSYHYVECNCPCEKRYVQLANRGRCTKCRHFHDAQPMIVISAQDAQEMEEDTQITAKQPQNAITAYLATLNTHK